MIGKFTVLVDVPDEYVSKRGTVVKSQIVTLIDAEPRSDARCIQPLDYTMTPDEKEKYAGKIDGRELTLAIREFSVFGGRFRVRGKIIEVAGLNGAAAAPKK